MASPLYRVLDAGTTASGAVCDAEMSESSAVDNPVPTVSDSVEMPESSGVDVPANINNSTSVNIDLADNANTSTLDEIGLEVNAVNGDSYAARTAGLREPPRRFSVHNDEANELPDRPRSAFFTPSRFTSARSVFDALRLAEIESQEVACMQRRMNGEVIITFKHPSSKERFLRLNALKIGADNYAVQDIDRPLTFLTIYDAPFELSDLAIIRRLAPYCDVLHYRRGRFSFAPSVCNGLRHYRVRVIKPIPSFLRFGKSLLFLKHDGQVPTCRRCNQPGHFSNQCSQKICFNCENLGHESPSCPAPVLCSICKSDEHLGKQCPYSWYVPAQGSPSPEPRLVDVDSIQDCASRYAVPQWMLDLEISGDESDESLIDEPVSEETGVDQDPPQPSPSVQSALDSQGFLNDSGRPTVFASRPSPPESLVSETATAAATIIPEVVVLDSSHPPEPAESDLGSTAADAASASEKPAESDLGSTVTGAASASEIPAESDLGSTAAEAASASEIPAESDLGSAAADAASVSETSSVAGTSADPIPVPVKPVPKTLGRRAPALLTEPISFLSRVRTAPVLVTTRPKSTPDVAAPSADAASEEDMDTSSTLKRKPLSAKEKKGRKRGKK